jgi:hypothetical protein
MPRYSERNRFTSVDIQTTATTLAGIRALGAIGFIVKVWGGSNGANPLLTLRALPSHIGTTITTVIAADGFGEALTNATEDNARPLYVPAILTGIAVITPWPTDFAVIELTMQTAVSNGCTVDVWAVYADGSGTAAYKLPST